MYHEVPLDGNLDDPLRQRNSNSALNGNTFRYMNGAADFTTVSEETPLVYSANARLQEYDEKHKKSGVWRQQWPQLLLLILLYTLQGVPLGITLGATPFLLQQQKSTLTQIGVFSLASWPYSLKLLWSPIVDTFYWPSVGRRKSWIVPVQCAIGLFMLWLSYSAEALIEEGRVAVLTFVFFLLIFLVATQDIAVDGWAISLLPPEHRAYGSTCQAIGQNIGYFMSYSVFLAMNSPAFCNSYLRSVPEEAGMLSLSGFFWFWGWMFIIVTFCVLFFKQERPVSEDMGIDNTLKSVYSRLWTITWLPSVKSLVIVLIFNRVAFAANDSITVLKLTEKGLPKENMAMLATLMFPLELVYPLVVGRLMQGGHLTPWLLGYRFRIVMCLVAMLVVWNFPFIASEDNASELVGWKFYVMIFCFQALYSFTSNLMFVSQCGFYAHICDQSIGGTYMTLLNTISNLGTNWPKFFIFSLADILSCKQSGAGDYPSECFVPQGTDGYYIISVICACYGVMWFISNRSTVERLQRLDQAAWTVPLTPSSVSMV